MKEELAKRLTLLRKEKGISQKEAAAQLGLSQALLSHYEKGIRECGLDFVARACTFYEVSADYLLGLSPMKNGEKLSQDLPDPTDEQTANTGDLALLLGRRIVFNGLDLLYTATGKTNRNAVHNLNNVLYLTVYKLFRLLYGANPHNDNNLFMIDRNTAPYLSQSALDEQTAHLLLALTDAPPMGQTRIEEEYPKRAGGLLNLIKNAENLIKR